MLIFHEAVAKYNKKTKKLTGHSSWQGFDKCCRMFFLVVGLPSVIKESENHKKAQSVAQDGKCRLIQDELRVTVLDITHSSPTEREVFLCVSSQRVAATSVVPLQLNYKMMKVTAPLKGDLTRYQVAYYELVSDSSSPLRGTNS